MSTTLLYNVCSPTHGVTSRLLQIINIWRQERHIFNICVVALKEIRHNLSQKDEGFTKTEYRKLAQKKRLVHLIQERIGILELSF